MQRHELYRTFPAIILFFVMLFVVQACMSVPASIPTGPGSPPPMDPPFDAYDTCIHRTFTDAGRQACFRETIQVNHLTLPAGTTAEQAYTEYKTCIKKNVPIGVLVGPFMINGNSANTARQDCFKHAVQ
jgi:hypothetical protein